MALVKTRLSYLAAMILYCLATNLTGQNETLVFHHLTTADDLTSQKFNYYVRKDSRGFVRISSADGLSIYDGREIQGIQTGPRRDSSRTLANPNISSSFFEDKAGDIWFSVIDGIQQYDRKHDRFLFHEMNLDGKKYEEDCYLVYLDTVDQNLWTRVDDTLMTWSLEDPGRRHIIERHEPLSITARMFRNPEAEELILLAPQSDGIQVRRFRSLDEQQDPAEYLPGFQVSCFHFIDDRTCWVGTDKGLVLLNLTNGVFQIFDGFEGEPITRIKGIVAPKEGELIIATQYNGLFRFSTKLGGYLNSIHMYREEGTGPFRYSIDALYLDYDQTLWISTTGKGIFFTNLWKKRFKALLQTEIGNSSCDGSIRSLAEDRKGRLWSLTSDGVTVIDTSGKAMPNFDRLSGQGVPFYAQAPYFLFVDDHDRIWAAMQQGLYFLPHARANFAPVAVADDSAGSMKTFTHVTQLSDGAVIAASTKGIFEAKAEGRAPPLLHRQKGVVPREGKFSWIREIPEENQVIVRRVEHSFQVYHPSENKWTLLTATRFKPFVNYLTRDCSGNFYWIATPRGLYRMTVSADSIRIRQDTILPFRTLNALLQDEATGHLWISTNRGLVRYVVETGRWQVYGIADGIQGDDFNFWSACKTREGKMAFGGVNGFNLFHPQEINQFPIAARPVITSILINEKQPRKPLVCEITGSANVTEIRSIKRAHSDNTFHIRFAALEFSDPKANTFRYKMSGIDDQWVETTGENLARYANLRHGRYLFELQASNSDLEWSDITKTLEIVITPPWYLLPAFQVIWALMVILVLYLLYKRHIKKLRKQQEAKLEQEAMQRKLAWPNSSNKKPNSSNKKPNSNNRKQSLANW